MKELKNITDEVLNMFDISDISKLSNELMECVLCLKKDKYIKYCEIVENDLSIDYLKKIYQYYQADRKNLKQDYTPISLSTLISKFSEQNNVSEVYDMCAGTGELTIQQWVENHSIIVDCQEIDENVIPYLLFNLSVRNIQGVVRHMDILSNDIFNVYILKKGDQFATVHKQPSL